MELGDEGNFSRTLGGEDTSKWDCNGQKMDTITWEERERVSSRHRVALTELSRDHTGPRDSASLVSSAPPPEVYAGQATQWHLPGFKLTGYHFLFNGKFQSLRVERNNNKNKCSASICPLHLINPRVIENNQQKRIVVNFIPTTFIQIILYNLLFCWTW